MHVLIVGLYSAIIWLSTLLYLLITGAPLLGFILLSPVVVSGIMAALLTVDAALWAFRVPIARAFAPVTRLVRAAYSRVRATRKVVPPTVGSGSS